MQSYILVALNYETLVLGISPQGHTDSDGRSLRNFSAEKYPAPRKKCSNNESFVSQSNYFNYSYRNASIGLSLAARCAG